jgi:hypothetical protein
MGGSSSGRHWNFGVKDTTDDYRVLDVRRWQRDGYLEPDSRFGWQWTRNGETLASIQVRAESNRVILSYRHQQRGGGEWKSEEYPIYLDRTPCTYGGTRAWFRCPAQGCGRRVAILYGGAIFACRHCHRLAYPSQRDAPHERAARLGWEPGILNGPGWCKSKGMHGRTYERLSTEAEEWTAISLAKMMRRFGVGPEEW